MSLQYYFLKSFTRLADARNKKLLVATLSIRQRRPCSSSSDSSDEENGAPKSGKVKRDLNNLLSSFAKVGSPSISNKLRKDVPKKVPEPESAKTTEEIELKEETKIKMKNLLLDFNKKTYRKEEEIKFSQAQPKEKLKDHKQKEKTEDVEFLDLSVKKAVKDVADLLGGDKEKTESELLESLQSVSSSNLKMSDIVSTMKVSKSKPKPKYEDFDLDESSRTRAPRSRLNEFRDSSLHHSQRPVMRPRRSEKVDVFGAEPSKFFPKDFKPEGEESILGVWDSLMEREKVFSVAMAPLNHFEEMINWTEKGMVWTFPIDNEWGLEEEKSYTFADHIFLEKHLEGWCPSKGPIRHFMELVCIGLSKNPHLTVNRKKAHIEWYKNYFDDKKELLQDLGAI